MNQQAHRILRFPQVRDKVGLGHTCIYEKIQRNEFPKPLRLGARAVGWLESDVDAWIEARMGGEPA